MYAIRESRPNRPLGQWLQHVKGYAGLAFLTSDRAQALRFPTIETAREAYRALLHPEHFLIVCADEDRK